MTRDHVPIIYHDSLLSESGADLAPHHLSFDQVLSTFSNISNPVANADRIVYAYQRHTNSSQYLASPH
jgi:hypothetical protein